MEASTLKGSDVFSGDYLSPAGDIRLKFIVQDDTVTLSDLAVRVKLTE